ncbi:LysR substrate-binding domain-containing protein [Terriglobus albidus]|uniref:LysR substrate-binding domain-containing protein n=1 Tax=Terriglobus albidus TaxID=1592106 RepID=UPI0021DF4B49|nr:LysR substrate-binding domain-containing protein [Terriglobus albidus]
MFLEHGPFLRAFGYTTRTMATRLTLDLDTLRTLTIANDLGSLALAAERLGRTPSAVSLQMKRLQEELGAPVFRKRGRGLALTEEGVVALAYARRMLSLNDELLDTMQGANIAGHIRIGCTQDFVAALPSALSHFALLYPRMQVELRIEGNAALADAVEAAQLDLAVVIGHEARAAAEAIGQLEIVWIAASNFVPPQHHPLPLAALGPQCAFRRRAIEHLETATTPYRVAASSPSLEGLWAALLAGLGITARTGLRLPEGLIAATSLFGLPALGALPVTVHRNPHSMGVAADRMKILLTEAVQAALASQTQTAKKHKLRLRVG